MPYDQILLAIDRTPRADNVFEHGIDVARKYNARLSLLHCIADLNASIAGNSMQPAGVA